ncbi:MAG: metal-dependent transcriptional regulator [Sulfolobales archaeon]
MRRVAKYGKSFEDYVEAIYLLEKSGVKVSVTSLARRLGVKPSSVVEQLKKLSEKKLIEYRRRGDIKLTNSGREYAQRIIEKHSILKRFLENYLRVPNEIADKDACSMEHYLHDITIERILKFMSFIERIFKEDSYFAEKYREFLNEVSLSNIESNESINRNSEIFLNQK